jgi:hypothetical protein
MLCEWTPPYHIREDAWRILHIHHIVPVFCGGTNERSNLIALCPNCHAAAHLAGTRNGNNYSGPRTRDELAAAILGAGDNIAGEIADLVAGAA